MENGLGKLLGTWRDNWKAWRIVFFVLLAIMVGLNFFINTHEPHFGLDKYVGFWPLFGVIVGLVMVIAMKKIIQPLIARGEDYYDR